MRLQIVFATGNKDKIREMREILNDPDIDVFSTKELGILSDPEETGTTFEENASIKSRAAARLLSSSFPSRLDPTLPTIVLSDDSGLAVDALNGAPGIYSSRYMGTGTSYTVKMNHILDELTGKKGRERSARFVCACSAVVLKNPSAPAKDPEEFMEVGTMEGEIAEEIRGSHGFGYDPFFYLPDCGKTSAELNDDEKNALSHRGKAFRAMVKRIRAYCEEFGGTSRT